GFGQSNDPSGLGGAQAELVRVPNADAMLESLPDEVSDVQAGFLSDVLPGAFAGLELGGVRPGHVVAVVGCGPTGLCAVLSARAMGAATVVAVDHHPERLEAARAAGALAVDRDSEDAAARVRELTEGRGADVAVEATGTAEGVTAALELVRPWGTLVTLGIFLGAAPEFPLSSLLLRHVTLKPAGVPPVKLYIPRLIRLIAEGLLDPTPLAKPLLPLSEAPRGYELMAKRRDGAIKVLLRPMN
ncbi:MAG: zinc-binding dehydrogenase, partial [Chloroflexi bacterium]|nr:zinc-binding dehydrogenase [Chloroflexota bacterium]